MAEKKRTSKKPTAKPSAKPSLPPALAERLPPSFTRVPADDRAPGGKGEGVKNLSKQQVDAIRLLAITMAGPELADDAVLICNPVGEPSALPRSELLYDTCRWCEIDIYYDRLMPSRPDLMRVCLKCGILLLEAEKKGAN